MKFLVGAIIFIQVHALTIEKVEFDTAKIKLGSLTLEVEIADNPKKITRGLMYRNELKKDSGMLFIFKDERVRRFWMKNTFVDLSIAYFDKNKKLFDIQDMKAVKSEMETNLPNYQSRGPAKYALEMNKGWFKRNKIKLGTSFEFINAKNP